MELISFCFRPISYILSLQEFWIWFGNEPLLGDSESTAIGDEILLGTERKCEFLQAVVAPSRDPVEHGDEQTGELFIGEGELLNPGGHGHALEPK